MVYIYKKTAGNKIYYYLRASIRKGRQIITKDISYLGSSIDEVKKALKNVPPQQIRKSYKVIQRFLSSNTWLEKAKALKLKTSPFLEKNLLEEIEACRLHWHKIFQKIDKKTRQDYFKSWIIDFAFNTTSIEGNTILLQEAALLLTEQLTPKNKTLREIYDIQNTEYAFNELIESLPELCDETVIKIHANLMKNIDARIGYRTGNVRVVHSQFDSTPARYIKTDINILIDWCKKNIGNIHPLALAVIFHHKFEKIHPFFDGNGRTGRMLLNLVLLKQGYPPIIIRKLHRAEYLEALRKADSSDITQADPARYKQLVEFAANELIEAYWDIFL